MTKPAVLAAVLAQVLSFDAATVKRNKDVEARQSTRVLPGGRIEVTNMPLRTLIRVAYGTQGAQIAGGPGWAASDGYDIVATVPPELAAGAATGQSPQVLGMLRSLLEERFKLQVHRETRETQTYALVAANSGGRLGPQLTPSQADCSPGATNLCGIRGGNGDVTYTGVTMTQIATSIAGFSAVGRAVADRTGLTGRYDLHLAFDPATESVFTALVEQAGLKLQAEKRAVEFVVIDRAERPTED